MKKLLPIALLGALVGGIAFAGDGAGMLDCPNECPFAQQANGLRSNGAEAGCAAKTVREDVCREVLAALDRV